MIASTLEPHNSTERKKFDFLSFSGANLVELAQYFEKTIANATNREGKELLARTRKVCGNKLIKDVIALLDWLEELNDQYIYNLKRFFALNPYHAERYLYILPALGENFLEFVTALDDGRGEDGLVAPKQIRDTIRQFLPTRQPRPKFDPGNELTEEHLAYFKKKLLGRSRKAEMIAEKEILFHTYLSVAEKIANGKPLKVEHLAGAIVRCGGDPATLLPRPSRQFTIWSVGEFLTGKDIESILENPETEGSENDNGTPEDETVSVAGGFEYAVNPSIPHVPEFVEPEEAFIESQESENESMANCPGQRFAPTTDTEKSPNQELPLEPAGAIPVGTIPERPVPDLPSPEPVSLTPIPPDLPVTSAGEAEGYPSQPELSLRPGVRVRTTGSGEVGRLLKITETGWLVKFKGGLNRILPAERLVALPDTDQPASNRAENNTKPKNSKKKGFGLSVA
ncbi:MAG: hypothetical protein ACKPH1_28900 [Microcystis panniformis]